MVAVACYPDLVAEPDLRGYVGLTRDDGTVFAVPMCKGLKNFLECFAREPDLTLEILSYARERCAEYDAGRKDHDQTSLVRAVLLRGWHATVVQDQEGKHRGEWRSPTRAEAKQLLAAAQEGKPHRLKVAKLGQLGKKQIMAVLEREYRGNVKYGAQVKTVFNWETFRDAWRSISS